MTEKKPSSNVVVSDNGTGVRLHDFPKVWFYIGKAFFHRPFFVVLLSRKIEDHFFVFVFLARLFSNYMWWWFLAVCKVGLCRGKFSSSHVSIYGWETPVACWGRGYCQRYRHQGFYLFIFRTYFANHEGAVACLCKSKTYKASICLNSL